MKMLLGRHVAAAADLNGGEGLVGGRTSDEVQSLEEPVCEGKYSVVVAWHAQPPAADGSARQEQSTTTKRRRGRSKAHFWSRCFSSFLRTFFDAESESCVHGGQSGPSAVAVAAEPTTT